MADERVVGVCAFIPHPSLPNLQFLGLRESEWKRKTNKLSGMYGPIMETVNPGETHRQALERGIFEELTGKDYPGLLPSEEELAQYRLCEVQLSPNAWVIAYLIESRNPNFYHNLYSHMHSSRVNHNFFLGWDSANPLNFKIQPAEVMEPAWLNIQDVLASEHEPDKYRFDFRPGVIEIVKSYLDRLKDSEHFMPKIYPNPINSVPSALFDILERDNLTDAGKTVFAEGDNDFYSLFQEVRIAAAMKEIGMDSTRYLERFHQYAMRVWRLQVAT